MALDLEYRVNALERVVNRLVFFMDTMLAEKSNPFIFGKSDGEQLGKLFLLYSTLQPGYASA